MNNLKKLLSVITILGFTTLAAVNVVACNNTASLNNLHKTITHVDLGNIYVGQSDFPNKKQLLKAIKEKNPTAQDLTTSDFTTQFITDTQATIVGANKYSGAITINYISNNFQILTKTKFSGDVYRMLWTNENVLYVGLIEWNNNKNNNILIKSTDGGKTFNSISNVDGMQVNSLLTDFNGTIWVGSDNGLYKSTDGINFTKVLNYNVRSLTIDNNKNIWVGTNQGILYKGSLIKSEFKKVKNFNQAILSLTFTPNNKVICVGTAINGYSGKGALYTSTDEINFKKNSKINNEVTSLIVSANGLVWLGTYQSYGKGNLYKSADGINFTVVKEVNNSVFSLIADKYNNIYIGTEVAVGKGVILKLKNGINFKKTTGVATTAWCLSIDNNNNIYAGTGTTNDYSASIYESEIIN